MKLLEEMFQFDQADLDFGIYRIIAMKREEIKKFLNKDLMVKITEELKLLLNTSGESELQEIDKKIAQIKAMQLDELETANLILKLEEKKKALKVQGNIADVEGDIYSHLTNFFERYYDDGDFISQRRYKDGAYAIPYEGEEVKLHWANADQYYIKTSEYFKDYTFKTGYGNSVHFKIVEAETENDNNKANEKRFFQLYTEKPFEITDKELIIYFEYRNGGKKNQNECIAGVITAFTEAVSAYSDYSFLLVAVKDGKSLLERQLIKYTARNSFDYFIHKDLGKFLNRELDFYIKNDVIFLDDIEEQNDGKTRQYLVKAKVIRKIARMIVAFLAQIEDFQKKLWLKKKFVVETNYCITLDRVPKKFHDEIITNTAQIEEWKKLFAIHEIEGNLLNVAYSKPLTKEFLVQNQFLVLDTVFFSDEFKEKIVDSINGLDENIDGLLIHSENFQALNLLQEKYREQVKCVYIDPPYNAQSSEILYKNTFKHSSWLSLIENRVSESLLLLNNDSVMTIAIDEVEQTRLGELLRVLAPEKERTAVTIVHNPSGQQGDNFSFTNEFAYFVYSNIKNVIGKETRDEEGTDVRTFRDNSGNNNLRTDAANCFYPIYVKDSKIIGFGDVCNDEYHPMSKNIPLDDGVIAIYPIDNNGVEKKWVFARNTVDTILDELWVDFDKRRKDYDIIRSKMVFRYKTTWTDKKYSANSYGSTLLTAMFKKTDFKYPKSIHTVTDCVKACLSDNKSGVVLDYFAGSGTTGHAVINLNREDGGNRKYILVEMGEYFDTVTKPRIVKVIYSEDWKDGKPVSRKGSSHAFKYIRLESYEDTLNNLKMESKEIPLQTDVSEQYMVNYMLDIETNRSDSLLNIDKFDKPFNYLMSITRKLESTVRKIDLVETFNYLIGLKVERSYAMQTFDADLKEGKYGVITASLKDGNTYKIKMIEGRMLSGDSVLVIWRELTGDKVKDNAVLDSFFAKKKISTKDFEYKKIYVNGDNNLPNLRADNEGWKVLLIEEEMKKKMFENANKGGGLFG